MRKDSQETSYVLGRTWLVVELPLRQQFGQVVAIVFHKKLVLRPDEKLRDPSFRMGKREADW